MGQFFFKCKLAFNFKMFYQPCPKKNLTTNTFVPVCPLFLYIIAFDGFPNIDRLKNPRLELMTNIFVSKLTGDWAISPQSGNTWYQTLGAAHTKKGFLNFNT